MWVRKRDGVGQGKCMNQVHVREDAILIRGVTWRGSEDQGECMGAAQKALHVLVKACEKGGQGNNHVKACKKGGICRKLIS